MRDIFSLVMDNLKSFLNNAVNGKYFMKKQKTTTSAAIVLLIAFTISMLFGLLRDRLLYQYFFSCCAFQLDVYNAAFRIPDLLFRLLVTGSLSAAFMPVFFEYWVKDKDQAYKLASSLMVILGIAFFVLGGLVIIFAQPVSALVAPGFNSEQISLMASLTKVMIFAQGFFVLSSFSSGMLQAQRRFLLPALAPIVYNIFIILGIVLFSHDFGIFAPAFGVVLGAFGHFLIQLPALVSLGFRFELPKKILNKGTKKILRLMLPRTLSLGLSEIESTLPVVLASLLPAGSLSLYYLAEHLYVLPVRLIGMTLGQAVFPHFSNLWARNKYLVFEQKIILSLRQVLYLTSFIASLLLVLRIPIVRLVFGSRQFPWEATVMTGRLIAFSIPAVISQAGIQILARAFYALQDTKTTFYVSLVSLVINIVLSLLGIYSFGWGVYSLVIALSVAGIFQLVSMYIILIYKVNNFNVKTQPQLSFLIKLFFINLVSGFAAYAAMKFLDMRIFDTTRVVGLAFLTAVSSIFSLAVFLFLSNLLKLDVFLDIVRLVKFYTKPIFSRKK